VDVGRKLKNAIGNFCGFVDDMLAVIKDKESLSAVKKFNNASSGLANRAVCPIAEAMALTTSSLSLTVERSTKKTASPKSANAAWPTASATVVLPMPPVPRMVINRSVRKVL